LILFFLTENQSLDGDYWNCLTLLIDYVIRKEAVALRIIHNATARFVLPMALQTLVDLIFAQQNYFYG
jgi:hypothetical protein